MSFFTRHFEILIVISLSLFVGNVNGKSFDKIKYCKGGYGCSWHSEFFAIQPNNIRLPEMTTKPDCIPYVARCAYWCQVNSSCVGFNYIENDKCQFFNAYSFAIYPKKKCVFYEIENTTTYSYKSHTNVAISKKSCHSSAVQRNSRIWGSWSLVDTTDSCAQTNDSLAEDNWWMIDLEQPIKLKYVTILTYTWNTISRLDGMIVAVTNTSWLEGDPPRSQYSVCFTNTPNTFTSSTYYNRSCSSNIKPGRYVLILQAQMKDSTDGYFTLCGFQAYPV